MEERRQSEGAFSIELPDSLQETLNVYATWLINYLWHYWEKWSEKTKMNILNQNKFQAGRNYSGAVQLPPGRVMEPPLPALFKIKPEQQGMMKHEQFFFF